MSLTKLVIGPWSQVYVGSAAGVDELVPILDMPTGTSLLTDEIPEEYETVLDNSAQTGFRTVGLTLSFYGDDDLIVKLARRISYRRC
jgi:hypothetical protein